MKNKTSIILLSLVLLATTSMAAQWWVPAAAHANGAQGSVWRTDLVIHNFSGETAELSLSLLPQNHDNSSLDQQKTYMLEAGTSLLLDDLLASEFSFNGTAALKIDSENDRLAISSRTYNLGADGSYGQTIPAVPSEDIVENEAYRILGISGSEGRRSNAGWVNLEAEETTVSVYLFDSYGNLLNSRTYSTPAYSQKQINDVFADLEVAPVDSAWLRIHSSGRIAPYASVVAAGSNDPIYVPPSRLFEASSKLLIPAAAHVNGLSGTQWKTDVWVMNIGSEPTIPTFELWPQSGAEAITVSLPETIVPGELLSVTDIISSIFGSTDLQGALILSADTELLATSRTYNTAPEGSFGQFIPSQPLNALPGAGDRLLLEGAVADESFRSNIGFVSTDDELRLSMKLVDPSGQTLAEKSRNLQAHQQIQRSVLSWFGLDSVPAGSSIEINIDEAQGGLAAYLSVVDSNSTDPSYRTAAPAYGETVDPQMVNQSMMATTYALSTAVDHSGPKMVGKTSAECIETNYEGDTLRPGESPVDKCWQADVIFNNCSWTLPAFGDELSIDGRSAADICITDGYDNVFDTDLAVTYFDALLNETHRTDIDARQKITMHFNDSRLASSTLIGNSVLSYDGESIRMESDLKWEDGLSGLEFIPTGLLHMYFPYETGHGETTGEALAEFDGTEWVLVTLKLGLYRVSYYVNIYTGEVRMA